MYDFHVEHERLCNIGQACPVCYQRTACCKRFTVLGVPLFQCPHCRAEWIDVTAEAAHA